MVNLQLFELIGSTKALQFKKLGVVSFTDAEKEILKEDKNHQHVVFFEFNSTLVKLNVPSIRSDTARKMLQSEFNKLFK